MFISILESLYLIFMFRFFRTSINFSKSSFYSYFFHHSLGNQRELRICPFGRVAIFALILILIGRHFFKISKKTINIVLFISFILSLMNMNALVYLVPVYLSIHIIE